MGGGGSAGTVTSHGGAPNFGGNTGGQMNTGGYLNMGGRPMTGGSTQAGGRTTQAGGQITGGTGGTGGTVPTGGRIATGGNTGGSGGLIGQGGSVVRGGSGGSIVVKLDAGFGGSAGVVGSDGGWDARDLGIDRVDSRTNDGTVGGEACQGLASNEDLIDDLNDGNRFILNNSGRVGSWTDSHDSTPTGAMYPDPVNLFTPTDTGDSCRKYAVYVKGSGFSDWGASFWFGLGSPYNASKYTGITFWARTDAGSSGVVRVSFPDKDTYPDGGICKTNVTGATQCYDHYGARVTLTPDWKKQTLSFKDLSQDGWGLQGAAFDPSTLFQVLFQIPVNATFGIWVDDVAFTF
jgi:hypothetical protein